MRGVESTRDPGRRRYSSRFEVMLRSPGHQPPCVIETVVKAPTRRPTPLRCADRRPRRPLRNLRRTASTARSRRRRVASLKTVGGDPRRRPDWKRPLRSGRRLPIRALCPSSPANRSGGSGANPAPHGRWPLPRRRHKHTNKSRLSLRGCRTNPGHRARKRARSPSWTVAVPMCCPCSSPERDRHV